MENTPELKRDSKEESTTSYTPLRPTFLDSAKQRLSVFWPAQTRAEPTIEISEATPLTRPSEENTSESEPCCSCTII